jgi:hypothetical protein
MKKIIAWIYGLQCFFVAPWFLGAFFRHEMSSMPWGEFPRQVDLHGIGDALFGLYLYAVFYSLPIVLAWAVLPSGIRGRARVFLSLWIGFTFFVLLPGLLQVAENGWLFMAWIATAAVALAFRYQLRESKVSE